MELADKAWPGDEWSIAPTDKADVSFLKRQTEKEVVRGREGEKGIERERKRNREKDSEGERERQCERKQGEREREKE